MVSVWTAATSVPNRALTMPDVTNSRKVSAGILSRSSMNGIAAFTLPNKVSRPALASFG